MVSKHSVDVAERARTFYESKLRSRLESSHLHSFVAVEPESGEYFLGNSLSEAIQAARNSHPNVIVYALRVGDEFAINSSGD